MHSIPSTYRAFQPFRFTVYAWPVTYTGLNHDQDHHRVSLVEWTPPIDGLNLD